MTRALGDEKEDGTILLLTLGCVVVALLLVVVVVDASAVFLARRALASDADGASLAAAQSVSGARLPLSAVQAAVARYEGDIGPSGLTSSVEHGSAGDTVVVRGSRSVRLPFVGFLGIGSVTVTAISRASSVRLATQK